jgi:hypothetical protein
MLVGYVAGPYRSQTEWGLVYNIRMSEEWALYGWSQGCAMISPHKNTAHFGGAMGLEDTIWLDGDLEIIRRCDFVFLVPGWERSSGTLAEIEFAKKFDIPLFYMPQDQRKFEAWKESVNLAYEGNDD